MRKEVAKESQNLTKGGEADDHDNSNFVYITGDGGLLCHITKIREYTTSSEIKMK